jgi:hypothetical protein
MYLCIKISINMEYSEFYCVWDIYFDEKHNIRVTKFMRMRWAGHVPCIEVVRKSCRILVSIVCFIAVCPHSKGTSSGTARLRKKESGHRIVMLLAIALVSYTLEYHILDSIMGMPLKRE